MLTKYKIEGIDVTGAESLQLFLIMATQNMTPLSYINHSSVSYCLANEKQVAASLAMSLSPGGECQGDSLCNALHEYYHRETEELVQIQKSSTCKDYLAQGESDDAEVNRKEKRRQTEVDQFYDAVGETSFSSQRCPQEILDDNSSSDDDEDEKTAAIASSLSSSESFLHILPDQSSSQDFQYKGIPANPPEVTRRGLDRGNPALIHRKAWLEVCDTRHRYGKNLRLYYRHWESLGCPTNNFFDWLDSKNEASGLPLPSLEKCPRSQLDSDIVLYIKDPELTARYALQLEKDEDGRCIVFDIHHKPVHTGPEGWIFVLRDSVFYGNKKSTSVSDGRKHRFHHSTFFGGKAVAAAGVFITNENGTLTLLYPHSGHYRPGEADMQRVLLFLHRRGIDLSTFQVDTQQLVRVSRLEVKNTEKDCLKEEKKKKIDSLHLKPALDVAHYLSHKARFICEGVFSQINAIGMVDGS